MRVTNQIGDNPATTSKQIQICLENLKTICLITAKFPLTSGHSELETFNITPNFHLNR